MRAEAIKLLEENLVVNSLLSVLPITFLDLIPKVESIKAKINMWDDIKLKKKKLCKTKEIINKMQSNIRNQRNIYKLHPDKGLISKIHKKFTVQQKKKNPSNLIFHMSREFEQTFFSMKDIQTANRYCEKCSISLIILNANKNHKNILLYTYKNGYHQKDER